MLLRTKIVLSATVAILVVVTVLICGQYLVLMEEQDRFARTTIQHESKAWSKIVSARLVRFQSSIKSITRNRKALAAINSNDRDSVVDNVVGMYNRLSANGTVDQIVVTRLDGSALVSLPAGSTLDKNNSIAQAAIRRRKIVGGALRLNDGRMAVALASPLYQKRRMIGVAVLVKNIKAFTSDLADADGVNAAIFTKEGLVGHTTDPKLRSLIQPRLAELSTSKLHYLSHGAKTYEAITFPINDYSGECIGHVAVLHDATSSLTKERWLYASIYISVAFVVIVLTTLMVLFLNRQFTTLQLSINSLNALSSGPDVQVDQSLAGNEITAISNAVSNFEAQTIALRKSEARFQRAIIGSSDGIWDWDIGSGEVYYSPKFKSLLGIANQELPGNFDAFANRLHVDDKSRVLSALNEHLHSAQNYDEEFRLRMEGGEFRWFRHKGQAIRDETGKPQRMSGSLSDIDELVAVREKVERLAYHDELCDMPNRTMFQKDVGGLFDGKSQNVSVSLIHLDLDNFKKVNDSLGHAAGDELLKVICRRVNAFLKNAGMGQAYRWGGDEFIIAVEEIDYFEVKNFCDGLLKKISNPVQISSVELVPTASIGVARAPDDGQKFDTLMVNADLALYRSKELGRNQVCLFSEDLGNIAKRSSRIERELRVALAEKQLFVAFQPQVDVETRTVTGLEALIRWQHPELGVLSPSSFLDVAEASKLGPEVGRYVLDAALSSARDWLNLGLDFGRLSINLSQRHIESGTIVEDFRSSMQRYKLGPEHLTAEVVESVFLENSNSSIDEQIEQLHELGVRIELDDFGTGYASLGHLLQLPIDGIKIDKSFIDRIVDDSRKRAITKCVMAMANELEIGVVCEGVERMAQLDVIKDFGPSHIQGYYISRPMSFDHTTDWLAARQLQHASDNIVPLFGN